MIFRDTFVTAYNSFKKVACPQLLSPNLATFAPMGLKLPFKHATFIS